MRYVLRFGKCVIHPHNVKQCYVLRDSHLRFGSYAVEIIITFCVKLLRFGLSSYVLGNVTFCGPTPPNYTGHCTEKVNWMITHYLSVHSSVSDDSLSHLIQKNEPTFTKTIFNDIFHINTKSVLFEHVPHGRNGLIDIQRVIFNDYDTIS